jgi:ketosteroid isomerase-like protein
MACNKGEVAPAGAPGPQVPPEAAQEEPQAPADRPEVPAEPDAPPLAKEKVRATVVAWQEAQNQGDFEAYSASYATRLTGIKRVGSKTRGYNRESWLEDRARMFRKKMKVEVEDIEIRANPSSAVVRFTQTWSSGKFKDVGPKQLVVIVEEGKFVIAREEMLSSAVLRSKRNAKGVVDGLFFVGPEIDGFILQPAEEAWAKGKSSLTRDKEPYVSTRAAALSALPAELKSLVGASVTVYGPTGACSDQIEALQVVVGVTPHFGYFQDEHGETRKVSDQRMARDFFKMASPYLVASLTGKCEGGVMQVEGKREVMGLAKVEDAEMGAKLQKAFDLLPANKRLHKEFKREAKRQGHRVSSTDKWYSRESLALFHDSVGNRHLAVVAASGWLGCDSFSGSLTGIFQIGVDGKVQLLETMEIAFKATGALDLNGDGRVEFQGMVDEPVIQEAGIIGIADGRHELLHSFGWEYHDCPC